MAKMDKGFKLTGCVLFKNSGVNRTGEDYFMVKVGGFTMFVDEELFESVNVGHEVMVTGEYAGDRYSRKTDSYTPQFEIESIIRIGDVVESVVKHPASTGVNGR